MTARQSSMAKQLPHWQRILCTCPYEHLIFYRENAGEEECWGGMLGRNAGEECWGGGMLGRRNAGETGNAGEECWGGGILRRRGMLGRNAGEEEC